MNERDSTDPGLLQSLRDENKRLHGELLVARQQLEHVLATLRQLYERG